MKDFVAKSNPAIVSLARAASRMSVSTKALWASRVNHVYGEMGGQRAVELSQTFPLSDIHRQGDIPDQIDLIIGMEVYYSLVCLIVASSSLRGSPGDFIVNFFSGNKYSVIRNICNLLEGRLFEQSGIYGFRNSFDFDWVPETVSEAELHYLSTALSSLNQLWEGKNFLISGIDPLQTFHKLLLPKNLMHITGQFYSPEWLAELLLDDIGYSGEGRLIDPFCGSGVFLLTAAKRALMCGASPREALNNILGIDLSPSACVAAKCNLVLLVASAQKELKEPVNLNILNADSIGPSIHKGRLRSRDLFSGVGQLSLCGESIPLSESVLGNLGKYTDILNGYGLQLNNWSIERPKATSEHVNINARERRIVEQLFLFNLKPAGFLATNPPWVGWEYMSRPYRAEIQPAWDAYDLFNAKGLEAAFLKEDLSTLAIASAWDLYLADSGVSVAVLKPSTMHADLTGRGIRRLSLESSSKPLSLEMVRQFKKMKVFSDVQAETCSWKISKGKTTNFPVSVTVWSQSTRGWTPDPSDSVSVVRSNVKESMHLLQRTNSDDHGSRWLIASDKHLAEFSAITGENIYKPRMGVFTGGANAVFYLEKLGKDNETDGLTKWTNIVRGAKRAAPQKIVYIEDEIVKSVVRGRDIHMWYCQPEVYMLFPHAENSKMYPIIESVMEQNYPMAWDYLLESADILKSRKGFAGWEKKILQEFFYTLQRIGDYTFSSYKVCWKYVSSELTICVIGADPAEKNIIPNDKVMFIPFEDECEAYFVGGILSSSLIRRYVHSCMSSRQISTNIIKHIFLPEFDPTDENHKMISHLCKQGHKLSKEKRFTDVNSVRQHLDRMVGSLYEREPGSHAV